MRQESIRLHILLLAGALVWQALDPAAAEGQELPHRTWMEAGVAEPAPPDLRLSLEESRTPSDRLAGGLAGALLGAVAGAFLADAVVESPDMERVVWALAGESIGLPLGVNFYTSPRGE